MAPPGAGSAIIRNNSIRGYFFIFKPSIIFL